jgi:hypothetical protein
MKGRMVLTIGVAVVISLGIPLLAFQESDPLTGTWKGDWGPSASDRNPVTLELKWDGKTLTGTVNPGPEGIALDKASYDPKTMTVKFEVDYKAKNRHYTVEGKVDKDTMTGSWNRSGRNGDFKLTKAKG